MANRELNKMGVKPILPLLLSMSLPIVFSMFIQSLYNMVDSYFVSLISEKAFRAVSLSFPIQQIIISCGVGIGVGANSFCSRKLGEGKFKEANYGVINSLIIVAVTAALFFIFGVFFTKPVFKLFTSDIEVYEMGIVYLNIVCIFSFASLIQISQEKTIQSTGRMLIPMLSQLVGSILNIALDPILIFGYFGFPAMGVKGAAVATIIGQLAGGLICIFYLIFNNSEIKLKFKDFKYEHSITKGILNVGFPATLMQSITAFLTMALNRVLMPVSEVAVSVLGVYYKIQTFVFLPTYGITQAVLPVIGYNYGAGKKSRIDETLKIGTIMALVLMVIGTSIFQIFPDKLMNIFNPTPEMLEIGTIALRIISISFIPATITVVSATFFQALGKGNYSLFVSILRQFVIILPIAKIMSYVGLNYIWTAYPIAETTAAIVCIFLGKKLYREKISIIPENSKD